MNERGCVPLKLFFTKTGSRPDVACVQSFANLWSTAHWRASTGLGGMEKRPEGLLAPCKEWLSNLFTATPIYKNST